MPLMQCRKRAPSSRRRVTAHARPGRKHPSGFIQHGVAPVRGDFGQRPHDEQTLRRPGMGQGQGRSGQNCAAVGDQVQVQGPRRIGTAANTAELGLDLLQRRQDLIRAEPGLDKSETVKVVRLLRVWPGRRPPPGRPAKERQTRTRELIQRRLKQVLTGRKLTLQIAAQGH